MCSEGGNLEEQTCRSARERSFLKLELEDNFSWTMYPKSKFRNLERMAQSGRDWKHRQFPSVSTPTTRNRRWFLFFVPPEWKSQIFTKIFYPVKLSYFGLKVLSQNIHNLTCKNAKRWGKNGGGRSLKISGFVQFLFRSKFCPIASHFCTSNFEYLW